MDLNKFPHQKFTRGFIEGFLGNDKDSIEFIEGFGMNLDNCCGIFSKENDEKTYNAVQDFSEKIYEEGSEMFEIGFSDIDLNILLYKTKDDQLVLFAIRESYSIAVWNDKK